MVDVVEILKALVRLPSVNPPGHEVLVCRYLQEFFGSQGLAVTLQEVAPDRHNLIARLPGHSPVPLIFTGHMDVVPVSPAERTRWRTDPFVPQVAGGRLYGRGATDMKAGLAAAMAAMVQLKRQGIVPPHDILLCATVDEEFLMQGSARIMAGGLIPRPAGIIVCEPTGLAICNSSRGRTFGRIIFSGHTGHGSDPASSLNALNLAHDFISAMKAVSFIDGSGAGDGTFWQALSIHSGVEPGVVPDQCTLGIDARLGLVHQPEMIWSKAAEILREMEQNHPGMSSLMLVDDEREPWQTGLADPFLGQLLQTWRSLDEPVVLAAFPGTTDGTKLRRSGAPCLISGPGDLTSAHRENESVDLGQVRRAVELYADFMGNFKGTL